MGIDKNLERDTDNEKGKNENESLKSEFEVAPDTKIRIVATVDAKLCEAIKRIHASEVEKAKLEDRVEPDWSNTIEMLLRKGAKAYKPSFSDAE